MSDNRFTEGNLIILYCKHIVQSNVDDKLPQHILERIKICINTYQRIIKSKPDGSKTSIIVVADEKMGMMIKKNIVSSSIDESKILIDSSSKSIKQSLSNVFDSLAEKPNPPVIYFVSSYQLKGTLDLAITKLKKYKIEFEGALDNRPISDVEEELKKEKLKKGFENIKEKAKNKGLDMLLNYIFPDNKK